jgi:hypothetical protein
MSINMKHLILILFTCLFLSNVMGQTNAEAVSGPVISFSQMSHDYGDIVQGTKVEWTFTFQNTGTEPLVISEVVTTCGCTATKWSKEPIAPGKSGEIATTFNSEGKEGRQNKVITILSNATNSPARINIIANVIPKK